MRPSRTCSAENCDAGRASPGDRDPDDRASALGPSHLPRRRTGAGGPVCPTGGRDGAGRGGDRCAPRPGRGPRALGVPQVLRPDAPGWPAGTLRPDASLTRTASILRTFSSPMLSMTPRSDVSTPSRIEARKRIGDRNGGKDDEGATARASGVPVATTKPAYESPFGIRALS